MQKLPSHASPPHCENASLKHMHGAFLLSSRERDETAHAERGKVWQSFLKDTEPSNTASPPLHFILGLTLGMAVNCLLTDVENTKSQYKISGTIFMCRTYLMIYSSLLFSNIFFIHGIQHSLNYTIRLSAG